MQTDDDKKTESLNGYKEGEAPVVKTVLTWQKDLIFIGATGQGFEIKLDPHAADACKPMEALLLSLAGCMGIDIVMILKKMRVPLTGLKMDLSGERNQTPPQYFKRIEMVLHVKGNNLDPRKIDRAIALSHEKYCSVYHSLRSDMNVDIRCLLEDQE